MKRVNQSRKSSSGIYWVSKTDYDSRAALTINCVIIQPLCVYFYNPWHGFLFVYLWRNHKYVFITKRDLIKNVIHFFSILGSNSLHRYVGLTLTEVIWTVDIHSLFRALGRGEACDGNIFWEKIFQRWYDRIFLWLLLASDGLSSVYLV